MKPKAIFDSTFSYRSTQYATDRVTKAAVLAKWAELGRLPLPLTPEARALRHEDMDEYLRTLVAHGRVQCVVHAFTEAGLGKAPFRLIGVTRKVYVACPGAPAQPGGTCAYCGTGIMNACLIESSDGKRFDVGCDCVEKTGDAGLKVSLSKDPTLLAAKREALKKQREKAKAKRDAARQEVAKLSEAARASIDTLLADDATLAALKAMPHPGGFTDRWTGEPLTLADWAAWMKNNAGYAKMLSVIETIRAAAAAAKI